MFFVVFNINTIEIYYLNSFIKEYLDPKLRKIISLIKQGDFTFDEEKHQFAFAVNRDLVFGVIRPCEGTKIGRDDITWNKKIELNELNEIAKRFSKIFTDHEVNQLIKNKYEVTTHEIWNRIKKNFFPNLTQIFLFGKQKAGLSSLMYLWLGFTNPSSSIDTHIPFDKLFNNSNILFIKPRKDSYSFRLRDLVNNKSNIIYIIDSTENVNSLTQNNYLKILRTGEGKILIIANRQDLPGANSPDIIEKNTGIPTVGFSAIDPDAPRHLEKIISDFLKN